RLRAALGNPIWWREEFSNRLTLATDRELRAQFISSLRAEFLKRDAEDWVAVLNSWKVPATLIQSFEEWAERPEAFESDALSYGHGGEGSPRPGKFINLRVG